MEPGSNEEIQQFVQQYQLSFQVAARQDVVGDEAHPLYQWLAHQQQNGLMDVLPPSQQRLLPSLVDWPGTLRTTERTEAKSNPDSRNVLSSA